MRKGYESRPEYLGPYEWAVIPPTHPSLKSPPRDDGFEEPEWCGRAPKPVAEEGDEALSCQDTGECSYLCPGERWTVAFDENNEPFCTNHQCEDDAQQVASTRGSAATEGNSFIGRNAFTASSRSFIGTGASSGPPQYSGFQGSCSLGTRGRYRQRAGIDCDPRLIDRDGMRKMDQVWKDCTWDEGAGCGYVHLMWTWQEIPVKDHLCNKIPDDPDSTQTDRATYKGSFDGKITACTDNTKRYEPGRTSDPYQTFSQMRDAQDQCWSRLYERYDDGHSPAYPYSATWTETVPEGWARGEDPAAKKENFMEWCMHGGRPVAEPRPVEGDGREMETELHEIWNRTSQRAGEWSYQRSEARKKYGEAVAYWEVSDTAWARHKCGQLHDELIRERQRAFNSLCEKQPYSHWEGCEKAREFCQTSDDNVEKLSGIGACCSDKYPEYHFFQERKFEIPCEPIGAFRWSEESIDATLGLFDRRYWVNEAGENTAENTYGFRDNVARLDNRGFVGSGGFLNAINLGGKEMEVSLNYETYQDSSASAPDGIGSYWFIDLKSGTIGFKTFGESKRVQREVRFPGSYKKGSNTDDRGFGDLDREIISQQRERLDGWVYNVYFCEETFTKNEISRISEAWGQIPRDLKQTNKKMGIDCENYAAQYQAADIDSRFLSSCQEPIDDDLGNQVGQKKAKIVLNVGTKISWTVHDTDSDSTATRSAYVGRGQTLLRVMQSGDLVESTILNQEAGYSTKVPAGDYTLRMLGGTSGADERYVRLEPGETERLGTRSQEPCCPRKVGRERTRTSQGGRKPRGDNMTQCPENFLPQGSGSYRQVAGFTCPYPGNADFSSIPDCVFECNDTDYVGPFAENYCENPAKCYADLRPNTSSTSTQKSASSVIARSPTTSNATGGSLHTDYAPGQAARPPTSSYSPTDQRRVTGRNISRRPLHPRSPSSPGRARSPSARRSSPAASPETFSQGSFQESGWAPEGSFVAPSEPSSLEDEGASPSQSSGSSSFGSLGMSTGEINNRWSEVPDTHVYWYTMSTREVKPDGSLGRCQTYDPWTGPYKTYEEAKRQCGRLQESDLLCNCEVDHAAPENVPFGAKVENPGLLP